MPPENETIEERPDLPALDTLISFDRFGNLDMDANITCPSIRDVLSEALMPATIP